ncbi:MAG: sigma-54 dependent transcriptional regulator [Deltaproteobacteria bacterium]
MTEAKARILVADDERSIRWVLNESLTAAGHEVIEATNGREALELLRENEIDMAFLDIRMPELSGLDVVTQAREEGLSASLVVMTAQTTMANAVEAMKRGAYDYLTKPFDLDMVGLLVDRAIKARKLKDEVSVLKGELKKRFEIGVDIVGASAPMQAIYKLLGRVAQNDATVLIQGESGTGKELIAKAIHFHSPRWEGPFIAINCSAIPRDLLESELFGFEKGAFTGAVERRAGKFEQANGGTLLLDEIGDMPLELQAKLLRVLQEKEFTRVGGRDLLRSNVRIVGSTNQDLAAAVRERRFREDLFFRLNVVPLEVPPLRARTGDIPDLIRHFLAKINNDLGTDKTGITPSAERLLLAHSWPGNVRELENALIRAAVVSPDSVLAAGDFVLANASTSASGAGAISFHETIRAEVEEIFDRAGGIDPSELYDDVLARMEKPLLETTMERTSGNQVHAAQILGINRNTLRKKLVYLGLTRK